MKSDLILKAKKAYIWIISWYPMYLLVAVIMTPIYAVKLLIEEDWFREFRYDVFKKRLKK